MEDLPSFDKHMVIVTPNRRLSAYLRQQYASHTNVQRAPHILPIETWIKNCWQQLVIDNHCPPARLMDALQTQLLWADIIKSNDGLEQLQDVSSTIKQAVSAWQTLKQWGLSPREHFVSYCEHHQLFIEWFEQFEQQCSALNALSIHHLPDLIAQNIHHLHISTIYTIGFDSLTPQIERLFSQMADAGHSTKILNLNTCQAQPKVLACNNTEEEIYAMARWAEQLAKTFPNKSIACIVPDLQTLRPSLARIFQDIFHPEKILQAHGTGQMHYNLSGGQTLSEFPMIAHAVWILNVLTDIDWPQLHDLITSPFIAGADVEWEARQSFTTELRQQYVTAPDISKLILDAKQTCPLLSKQLESLSKLHHTQVNSLHTPSVWQSLFQNYLDAMGWPGEKNLDSQAYQLIKHWYAQLATLSKQDYVYSTIGHQQALNILNVSFNQAPVQIQSETAQVQILGLLEAAGINFDAIWLMGLHQDAWPISAKPNPFIPAMLQREHAMPHASAMRELNFSKQMMQRLISSTENLVFSYPQTDADRVLHPSVMLNDFTTIELDTLINIAKPSRALALMQTSSLEKFEDNFGPSIDTPTTLKGGTYTLKRQLLCPFSAFAKSRLQADEVLALDSGLNAMERGILIHHALEAVWKDYASQLEMQKQVDNAPAFETYLKETIDMAWKALDRREYTPLLKQGELQRTYDLLMRWLTLELQRPSFRVTATESPGKYTSGHLTFRYKIDRIDQLENGQHLIIDYKTGQPKRQDWFGDPPFDVQMPIYHLVSDIPTQAISYAQLNPKALCFKGVSENELLIDGIDNIQELETVDSANSWTEQCLDWHTHLDRALRGLQQGDARVAPVHPVKVCQYCDLHSLCRVHEQEMVV